MAQNNSVTTDENTAQMFEVLDFLFSDEERDVLAEIMLSNLSLARFNGLPGSLPAATPKLLTSKATVTILLNDLNEAPTFATPTLNVSRVENSVANAAVVTVKATDGDTLDGVTQLLTFSLLSVINGDGIDVTSMFAINPTTGAVTVIPAKLYNFESTANKTFTLTVRATEKDLGLTPSSVIRSSRSISRM